MRIEPCSSTKWDHQRSTPGIIAEGWVVVCMHAKPVAVLGKGDFTYARDMGDVTLRPLGPVVFDEVENSGIRARSLISTLAAQAYRLTRPALPRTADFFVEILDKCTEEAGQTFIPLPLSQKQLSELLGMSAVHTNRVLQCLRREGAIEQTKGGFNVLDRHRLVKIANDDKDRPKYLAR